MDIETNVTDKDVYWNMHWGENKTGSDGKALPVDEMMFNESHALAFMLINEVIFLNNHWWHDDWPADAKKRTCLCLNTGDVFVWGCADAEELNYGDIRDVYDHWKKDPRYGTAVWACKKNKLMPQKPLYRDIQSAGIWDLDTMELRANG